MKALILNSGMGTRMGSETKKHPKCMTKITEQDTILSRQLKQLSEKGVKEIVITTGYLRDILNEYIDSLKLPLQISLIHNADYASTNYIYSIYLAYKELINQDVLILHGDLVFDDRCLDLCLESDYSCVTVDKILPLPEKDFKGVIKDGRVISVGISFFENSVALQPMYKLFKDDWNIWLNEIAAFCEDNNRKCYAEEAFNRVSDRMNVIPLDINGNFCGEIDNADDLLIVRKRLR